MFSRNNLLNNLLARCPTQEDETYTGRRTFMDRRGEGVPIILDESFRLSGKMPEYLLVDDAELILTIYAATPPEEPMED